MAKPFSTRRKYDSSRRQAQAQETRRQVAEAARALFIERGYNGTTIDAIAQAAGVASETVYAIFGSKRKILWHLMDISIGGDDQPLRLIDRPEPQLVLHLADPAQQIALFSNGITQILARAAPVIEVLRSAAKNDHEIAGLLQRMLAERKQNMTTFVEHIAANNGLRAGLDIPGAADLVWTITSPEVFLLLTRDRQYSQEQYSAWLQSTLSRLLLD